ncbi:hypothetical protein RYX36_009622 [Vicia faba]
MPQVSDNIIYHGRLNSKKYKKKQCYIVYSKSEAYCLYEDPSLSNLVLPGCGDVYELNGELSEMIPKPVVADASEIIWSFIREMSLGSNSAFTPTCSLKHVPGFIEREEEFKGKGVGEIVCISVNDPFVLNSWAKTFPRNKHVKFLADGSAKDTHALGLEFDLTEEGLDIRSRSAFTPTCSLKHVPGFIERAKEFKGKGVGEIVCIKVNDPFVLNSWAKTFPGNKHVKFLADGSAKDTHALGSELDLTEVGLDIRSRRFSLVVEELKMNVDLGERFVCFFWGGFMSPQTETKAKVGFQAGVKDYKLTYYTPEYQTKDTDILAAFRVTPQPGVPAEEAGAAVAAESSTGTWTTVWTDGLTSLDRYKGRCYEIEPVPGEDNQFIAYVAYPLDLFEEGSVTNMFTSIVGNVFGFKALRALRLEDLRIPNAYVKTFQGPPHGIQVERDKLNKYGRPLLGCTIKPKLGLSAKNYGRAVYECLRGGLDFTKDDENVNSQPFMRWRDRFLFCAEAIYKSQAETGEIKGHYLNATAGTCEEMLKRAVFARELGVPIVMHDYLTGGFTANTTLSHYCRDNGLLLHIHRAMHAVIDRQKNHGMHFRVLAKALRMSGGDHIHAGTVVGKLEGEREITLGFVDLLRDDYIEKDRSRGIYFTQDWVSLPGVIPVASGGIHVWHMPALTEIFGDDSVLQFGGGTLGHPWGNAPGAVANRVALEIWDPDFILSTNSGQIGVLKNHAPIATSLDIGILRIRLNDRWLTMALMGGFARIGNNEITILVNDAERGSDINPQEAQQTLQIAEANLNKAEGKRQTIEANLALRRARTRVEAINMIS